MKSMLSQHRETAYALMRIVVAFLFFCHGAEEVVEWAGGEAFDPLSLDALAVVIEVIGGIMIMVGWKTGLAAFICSGEMAVAYFMAHQFNGMGILPIVNEGELAVLYCFIFLFIATAGAGKWSFDNR